MATICILANETIMNSLPHEGIKVDHNFGHVKIITADNGRDGGNHIIVSGEDEKLKDWLRPHSPIWVGIGSPMMQSFEQRDVR